ncbi:MAG: hypothetical protein Alis3KO_03030 [Aliiglaciecola sp.]
MKHSAKILATASVLALTLSGAANASITASVQTVCEKAERASSTNVVGANTEGQQAYSDMLSQHFNLSSCNGLQLLNNTPSNLESKSSESEAAEVAHLTD